MHTPGPQPNPDRDLLTYIAGALLANPETILKSSTSTIIDESFKPTGKRAFQITLDGVVDDVPAQFISAEPAHLRHARTQDGSITVTQEYGPEEEGKKSIRTRVSIYRRAGDDDMAFSARGSAVFSLIPPQPGYSRQCFRLSNVFNEEPHTENTRVIRTDIDITDQQEPPPLPDPADVLAGWIEAARAMIPTPVEPVQSTVPIS